MECKHALPEQMILFRHAILLYKLYNIAIPEMESTAINFQQLLTSRQTNFSVVKSNQKRVGNNILGNGLHILNNKVKLTDTNN